MPNDVSLFFSLIEPTNPPNYLFSTSYENILTKFSYSFSLKSSGFNFNPASKVLPLFVWNDIKYNAASDMSSFGFSSAIKVNRPLIYSSKSKMNSFFISDDKNAPYCYT